MHHGTTLRHSFVFLILVASFAVPIPDSFAQGTTPVAIEDAFIVEEDQTLSVTAPGVLVNDYDPSGGRVTARGSTSPAHGSLSLRTDGSFDYTPDPGYTGTDAFDYAVENDEGTLSSFVSVTIEVVPDANRAPEATSDHYVTTKARSLSVSSPGVLDNDYDPDGDHLEVKFVSSPPNGSVSMTTAGEFTYTPNPAYTGTDTFSYQIADSSGETSSFVPVTIHVKPEPNRAPTPLGDAYAVMEGNTLTVNSPGVLANDVDPDGDGILAPNVTNPANGQVSFTTAGTFDYTPDPGFTGEDTFQYRLRDEHGRYSGFVDVAIQVLPTSQTGPAAVTDAYATIVDSQLVVEAPGVLENDLDVSGTGLTLIAYSSASNGSVSAVTNGKITYTPDPGFTGQDSFVCSVEDGNGNVSSASVTVTVRSDPNRAPEATPDRYVTTAGTELSVPNPGVLDNDYDADGDDFRATNVSTPVNGSISLTTAGTVTYTPDPGFTGEDFFSYRIADDQNEPSNFVSDTITVKPDPNRTPQTTIDRYHVFQDQTLSVPAPGVLENDYDADGDAIRATNLTQPSHGSVNLTTAGDFDYTPDPGFTGTDIFAYRIQDANGAYSTFETVEVAVTSNAALPVELAAIQAMVEGEQTVLTWQTASEENNAGFEIQRRLLGEGRSSPGVRDGDFESIGFVEGAGTVEEPQEYRFTDRLPFDADTALYRLRQVDLDGSATLSDPVTVVRDAPERLAFVGTAPNPVRQSAIVRYLLPTDGHVELAVFDLLGRRVATLVDEMQTAGRKTVRLSDDHLSNGVHVLVLQSKGTRRVEKISVVR